MKRDKPQKTHTAYVTNAAATKSGRQLLPPKWTGDRQPAIRVVLLPRDTNKYGTIFGGIILSHIDLAVAAEVGRLTRQRAVTVSIKEVVFKHPVMVGELVSFYARTTHIGRTSISVHVDVEADRNGETVRITQADLTYVCVNEHGKPTPVKLAL